MIWKFVWKRISSISPFQCSHGRTTSEEFCGIGSLHLSCCILVSEVCPGRKLAATPKHLGFLDKFGKDAVSHQKSKLWKLRLGDRKSLECTHTHFVLFCTLENWEIRLTMYFPNREMASGTLQPLVEKSHYCQWSIAQKQCLLHLRVKLHMHHQYIGASRWGKGTEQQWSHLGSQDTPKIYACDVKQSQESAVDQCSDINCARQRCTKWSPFAHACPQAVPKRLHWQKWHAAVLSELAATPLWEKSHPRAAQVHDGASHYWILVQFHFQSESAWLVWRKILHEKLQQTRWDDACIKTLMQKTVQGTL